MQIRLSGEGEAGTHGGPPGNLYVVVNIKKHPHFTRDGNDLLLDLPIHMVQAALGDEIDVATLDGEVKLTIPAGTQHGKSFRVKDHGVPILRRNARGDLIVTVHVVIPKELNEKQKTLLRELAKTMGKEPASARDKSVLGKVKDALKS